MKDEIEALAGRVARLESSRRRLRIAAASAGAIGAALILIGARPKAKPRVIEGSELRLVDASGTIRAVFSAAGGAPLLTLRDEKGKERFRLSTAASDGGTVLSLCDASGKARLTAAVGADGVPSVALSDADGNPRASLGLSGEGVPHLRFSEADGRTRASLGATTLRETHSGAAVETDAGSLILFDPRGKVVFKMPR